MRMHLAGIEWLTQAPAGNRLRWWYPVDEVVSGAHRGLPRTIVVERAALDEDLEPVELKRSPTTYPTTASVPSTWWDQVGDVSLLAIDLPVRHRFTSPVQAVRFTYRGPSTRLLLRDSARDQTLLDTVVADGDPLRFEGPEITDVVVHSPVAVLQGLHTLDLFEDRGLPWEEIAVVGVAPTVGASLPEVIARHGGTSSLSDAEWGELVHMAQQASASTPGSTPPGEPTRWQSFNLTLALRWELADLFGFGFADGPHADVSPLDEIGGLELGGPASTPLAYRVRDPDQDRDPDGPGVSNLVVCPPWPAPPLTPPSTPWYVDPQVRLAPDGTFGASTEMRWTQSDPRAIGAVVEEDMSASPTIGSPPSTETFEHRTRLADDPPLEARLARSFDVPFHDVTLTARVRAADAWDRRSGPSPASNVTSLNLHHQPVPPGLRPGTYAAGTVTIPRQHGDAFVDEWAPDVIVTEAAGTVGIYRQVGQPRVENGTSQLPVPVAGDRYRARIGGVANLGLFDGGYLNVRGSKYAIVDVVGSDVLFDAPGAGNSGVALFPAGAVALQQDDKDVSLWTHVADFPAVGLPSDLVFTDTVPGPTGGTDVLSYVARVAYLGRLGPASNVAQVVRVAPTPPTPPPFSVDLLGVDFYDRTMVRIRLTTPVSSGQFSVWWADGVRNATQFEDHATPGEYVAQPIHQQRYLFDVLAIPVPRTQARTITVGVQGVSTGGGQSGFNVVPVTITP